MIHIIYVAEGIGSCNRERAAYETAEDAITDMRTEGHVVEVVAKLAFDGCVVRIGRDDYVAITALRLYDKIGRNVEEAVSLQSQRAVMRQSVRLHPGDKDAAVNHWLEEYTAGRVGIIGEARHNPKPYALALYADGVAKGWLSTVAA